MNKLLTSLLFLCLFAFASSQDFTRFLGLRHLQDVSLTAEDNNEDNGETEEPLEEGWLEEECLLEEGGAGEEETNVWEEGADANVDVDVDVESRLLSFRNLEEVTDDEAGENGEAEASVEEGELEEECLLEEGGAEEENNLWGDVDSRLLGFRNLGEVTDEEAGENGEAEATVEEGELEEECLLEEGGAEEEGDLWDGVDSRLLSFRNLQEGATDESNEDIGETETSVEEGELEEEWLLEEGGAEEGSAEEEGYLWDDVNSRLLSFRVLEEVNNETEENGETETPVEEGELEEEWLLEEGGAEEGYPWVDDNLVL